MNPKAPLGLPTGSVRAILALLATLCAVVAVQRGMSVPDWFIAVVAAVVAQYFGNRSANESNKTGADNAARLLGGTRSVESPTP